MTIKAGYRPREYPLKRHIPVVHCCIGRRPQCAGLRTVRLVAAANRAAGIAVQLYLPRPLHQTQRADRLGIRLRLVGMRRVLALHQHASLWRHAGLDGGACGGAAGAGAGGISGARHRRCSLDPATLGSNVHGSAIDDLPVALDLGWMAARLGFHRLSVGQHGICPYR